MVWVVGANALISLQGPFSEPALDLPQAYSIHD